MQQRSVSVTIVDSGPLRFSLQKSPSGLQPHS